MRLRCATRSVWLSRPGNVRVVDLDPVDLLDSAGLGVLIGGMTLVRAHGGSLASCVGGTGR